MMEEWGHSTGRNPANFTAVRCHAKKIGGVELNRSFLCFFKVEVVHGRSPRRLSH